MATTALVAGRVLPFDADEYRERQKKAREKMKNQGIDVMILFAQESMYYLFGYDGGGFVFFQAVVMNVDASAQTALLCRMPDVAQASPLFDVCEVWVNAPENNPARDLIKLLGRVGITPTMKLGLETDTYGLTGRNYALLIDTLDEYGYQRRTEASHVVRALRLTKSTAEIEKMRQASKLCDQAFHAGLDAARGGVRDSVVSGTAMAMMIGNGGDLPPSWLVNSGDATSLGRSLTGGRVLNDTGDSLVFEICGVYHRYCVVVERTVSLGTPSASKLAMHDAIKLALQKMMSIAKPGITLGDLYEAASSVLTGKRLSPSAVPIYAHFRLTLTHRTFLTQRVSVRVCMYDDK